ncbi:MAG: SDR family oxidoreductase [Saprospiraceae bacterium]|nr:SDR family oxidoreductase [Saprospiraceae bacterium]
MNIIITGASKGIGYDTALKLAENPENKILALSRNEQKVKELAVESDQIEYLVFDITSPDIDALLQKVEAMGGVDILLNNAGLLINKPFRQLTMSDWQRSFGTNILGVIGLIRTLLPYLEKSSNAHIINIGSMGGFQGSSKFPGLSAYSASKAAVANLTECLAEELKDQKIAVNCLAFGAVQTEMLETAFPGYQASLSSEKMAEWVAWFCLNGHQFFNGKILPVSVSTP